MTSDFFVWLSIPQSGLRLIQNLTGILWENPENPQKKLERSVFKGGTMMIKNNGFTRCTAHVDDARTISKVTLRE